MIYEYALEPRLVARLHDKALGRFVQRSFGLGTGRLVCQFPKKWVAEAFQECDRVVLSAMERARATEIIRHLSEVMTTRSYQYDSVESWMQNATAEHQRMPFRQILDHGNFEEEIAANSGAFDVPSSVLIPRTPAAMANAVTPLLAAAKRVLLIDPYFRADRPGYRKVLTAFLIAAKTRRTAASDLVVEAHADASRVPWRHFKSDCERLLPYTIPSGITLTVRRWLQKPGGQQLHNRYILTNLGGVRFGAGLDEGENGATDEVDILGREAFEQRWGEYGGAQEQNAYGFTLEDELFIAGTRQIP